jgi:uncharacterized membrane protein YoaK (UPF0700 family)
LPGLLLTLTFVTGIVDAVSILALDRVFVANMTGNVAFIGFAIGEAPGFSLTASVVALVGFALGTLGSSRVGERWTDHRGHLLRNALVIEIVVVGAALAIASLAGSHPDPAAKYVMVILLGGAMGSQNAAVRRVGVPDLTTTVLTMTLTGLLADRLSNDLAPRLIRRMVALLAMFGGAAVGAVLVLDASLTAALGTATGFLALVAGATDRFSAGSPEWSRALRP